MKLVVATREPRPQEKRTLRIMLTLVFVVAGLAGGAFAARSYNALLKNPPYWLEPFQAGGQLSAGGQILAVVGLSVAGALLGFLLSSMAYAQVLHTQTAVESMSAKEKLALFLGLVFGLVLTLLIALSLQTPVSATVAVAVILCYLSVAATMSIKEQLRFYYPGGPLDQIEPEVPRQTPKLLDTNVIIDGRIVDICRTGFVEGPVFICRFILDELQHIADSSDSLKRARGRRGLDILNQMRKELGIKITTYDPEGINLPAEVDSKLVTVAQHLEATIITNDFNLNKVAELQGVAVLNVNELANALKPVVLPGEPMSVTVIKGGKEPNQGVAYLDDGTMVVIENAKRHIGERVDVIVASVWQTVAGKMIFASLKEEEPGDAMFPDAPAQARPMTNRPRRR